MERSAVILALGMCGVVASGCRPGKVEGFESPQPAARVDAILEAAARGDQGAVRDLIVMLDSDDPLTRMLAIRTLERLTGESMGYAHDAPEPQRRAAVDRWVAWYEAGALPA